MLVNEMAERIAQGKSDIVLLAIGTMKSGCNEHEKQYGFSLPINTYPLFENALRAQASDHWHITERRDFTSSPALRRRGAAYGIGRLADDVRFLANTPDDPAMLEELMRSEGVGREGTVTHENGKNIFRLG